MIESKQRIRYGIVRLYCGGSGGKGFYNSQEIGLAKELNNLGYESVVFFPDIYKRTIKEEKIDGITVVNCPAKAIGVHSRFDFRVLSKYEIEIAQINGDNQVFAPKVIKYCERNGIKTLIYSGSVETDSDSIAKRILLSLLFRRNLRAYRRHKNFVKTDYIKNRMLKYGISGVDVAPVGLDISIIPEVITEKNEIRRKWAIPMDSVVLLFVGRMEKYKRPELFIELLKGTPSDYFGIIIGEGSCREEISDLIQKEQLSERVLTISKIPNKDIHELYKAADYYINTNNREIFGMGILEAMYQGCNVIAISAPGPETIIKNRKTGYLVENINKAKDIVLNNCRIEPSVIIEDIKRNHTWHYTAKHIDDWIKSEM